MKEGKLEVAAKCYTKALEFYHSRPLIKCHPDNANEQRVKSCNNLALVHYKLGEWRACEEVSSRSLEFDIGGAGKVKTLLMRAMARKELNVSGFLLEMLSIGCRFVILSFYNLKF